MNDDADILTTDNIIMETEREGLKFPDSPSYY